MKKSSSLNDRIWPLVFLSCALSIGNILFIPVIFYSSFQEVFQLTNTQIGNLTAAYASIAVPAYLVGGWVADKFNAKKLMLISVFSTSLLIVWMSTIPNYRTLFIIFFMMSISLGLLLWTPSEKLKRLLGNTFEQGRIGGITAAIDGVITFIIVVGLSAVLGESLSTVTGMRILLLSLAAFYFISGVGLMIGYDYDKFKRLYGGKDGGAVDFGMIFRALKMPVTWIMATMCFGGYITSTAMNYFNPYLTTVYGMPVAFAAVYSAMLRYGFKIFATPIGGQVRDHLNDTFKVVTYTMIPTIVSLIILAIIPSNTSFLVVAIIVSLLAVFFYRVGAGLTMVPLAELEVPSNTLGTVIGIAFFFGFCSDWFLPSLIGKSIDSFGGNAYYIIFSVAIIGSGLYILGAYLLKREVHKQEVVKSRTETNTVNNPEITVAPEKIN